MGFLKKKSSTAAAGPKRMRSNGSNSDLPRDSNGKRRPYPTQIVIDDEQHEKDEVKYWKEKALELEDAVVTLAATVKSLEQDDSEEGLGQEDRANSAPAVLGHQHQEQAAPPAEVAPSPPPSPSSTNNKLKQAAENKKGDTKQAHKEKQRHDKEKEKQERRKDKIMHELVSEMERIIKLHTETNHASPANFLDDNNEGGDNSATTSASGGGEVDSNSKPPPPAIMETSALEDIVTRALAAERREEKLKLRQKLKKRSHYTRQDFYQLSCKHCVGQNFVGSTKSDLREKVRGHYGVVWQVVRTAYGKGEEDVAGEENEAKGSGNGNAIHEHGLSFRASSFSHHLAEHCKDCESEERVQRWCLQNVKVERIGKHSL